MKKRGISPLIATVILIGFVVAVAVVVMTWGRGFIKERAEKEGALSQAQLECNQVEIEITENNNIMNIGSRTIDGFIIRDQNGILKGDKDYQNLLLPVGEISEFSVGSEEEVIPGVRPDGAGAPLVPCSDKAKTLR